MDIERLHENVHDIVSRRAVHPIHRDIADMESTEDGMSNIQHKMWICNERE